MKKFATLLLFFAIALSTTMAQSPQQFKYQAALRDADGAVMANETAGVLIEILQGSTEGTVVFTENHSVTTTAQGIINLNVGSVSDLSAVDWSADAYFIRVTVNGTVMGVSQLLSVPYAQYANEAGNVFSGSYNDLSDVPANIDTDATDDFSGNYNDLENKPSISSLAAVDNAVNNQLKNVSDPTDAQDAVTMSYLETFKSIIYDEMLDAGLNAIVKDIDGNIYKTIKIGGQVWMAENLRTTTYNDGVNITLIDTNSDWIGLTTDAYGWYNNDSATYSIEGALYNWYAVNSNKLCPEGWHVPTDNEWKALEINIGMSSVSADSLGYRGVNEGAKIAGSKYLWNTGVLTDNSVFAITGFDVLPTGYRDVAGGFFFRGSFSFLWTADEFNDTQSYIRHIRNGQIRIYREKYAKNHGFSVRCLKD